MSNDQFGKDWFSAFREAAKDGAVCTVEMIPIEGFDAMMEAAERGDENARNCVIAFTTWTSNVEQAAKIKIFPACFQCGQTLVNIKDGGDGIGGFVLISQTAETDGKTEGAVTAFCPTCKALGPKALLPKLREAMQEEVGVDTFDIQ
jgi:hypothetical protein